VHGLVRALTNAGQGDLGSVVDAPRLLADRAHRAIAAGSGNASPRQRRTGTPSRQSQRHTRKGAAVTDAEPTSTPSTTAGATAASVRAPPTLKHATAGRECRASRPAATHPGTALLDGPGTPAAPVNDRGATRSRARRRDRNGADRSDRITATDAAVVAAHQSRGGARSQRHPLGGRF
jgi:hypothetical protein